MPVDPSNPFLALFQTDTTSTNFAEMAEHIFGLTRNRNATNLVYLEELSEESTILDASSLERALFERILLSDPLQNVVVLQGQVEDHVKESRVLLYLYQCFKRAQRYFRTKSINENDKKFVIGLMARNAITSMTQPELFDLEEQGSFDSQILFLLNEHEAFEIDDDLFAFLNLIAAETEFNQVAQVIKDVLRKLHKHFKEIQFGATNRSVVNNLVYFTAQPNLATMLLDYNEVVARGAASGGEELRGSLYGDTIFGELLSKSCLPRSELEACDFFDSPSAHTSAVHNNTEMRIHSLLNTELEAITQLFSKLMRCGDDIRHRTLSWIGGCLQANVGRGKLWSSEISFLASTNVGDGFMLNLSAVLIRLCQPFIEGAQNPRLLKIDLGYSKIKLANEDLQTRSVHLRDMEKETYLVPDSDDIATSSSPSSGYNFMTDVLFLTHKALDLGLRVAHEKLIKLNQELSRQMNLYNDARAQGSPQAEEIHKRTEMLLQRFLTLKAAVLEPNNLLLQSQLCAATCSLLVQSVINQDNSAERTFKKLHMPLKHKVTAKLRFVPEFFVSNVSEHLLLVRRFGPEHFEQCDFEILCLLVDFVLVYMSSSELIKNPHLRARLAENLECLLPVHKQQGSSSLIGAYKREQLFETHPFRLHLVSALMDVFVSIEATGEAVEFEQKFSYRRPMYDVIKYLWEIEEYKQKFVSVAKEAEDHMLDERAPLFLRFVHLLINDAIFLLDEALGFMKQLQEQEAQREQWTQLNAQERAQNEAQFHHIGRLAKYHNIMGLETIGVLEKLSSTTTSVLTHSTMVDRVAAMLNYFLKTLVGPERRNFKVADIEKYEFRPKQIVTTISSMYVHFSSSPSFLKAVTSDGRSYSPELFVQAESVLLRINEASLATKLIDLSQQMKVEAEQEALDEALLADAPDNYLDPIMSNVMRDPVLLPTSGKIVDRQTIARHLLSDQSDPFNRAPLTLDKVMPQDELREEIEGWIELKRKETDQKTNNRD